MVLKVFRSKKFAKRVLIGLSIIIIPAFVLWGAGSISRKPSIIGMIGGQKIYPADFIKSLRAMKIQLLLNFYTNFDTFNQIMQNRPVLNRLAWERLIFLNSAKEKNLKITNEEVLSFLAAHPLFQRNGVFDQQVYRHIIKSTLRMEPREFEELVRENLRIKALQDGIFKKINVSDEELMRQYKKFNDKIDISCILVDSGLFADIPPPSEEEVRNYYDTNIQEFYTPARIDIEYIEIPYRDAEQKKEAVKTLELVYAKLKKYPERFGEISGEHGLNHQETGPVSQDDLIPGMKFSKHIYDIAFGLDEGGISPPMLTDEESGAAYILRKIKDIPPHALAFDEVKEAITGELLNGSRARLAGEKADSLYDGIAQGGITLEEAGKGMGKEVRTAEGVSFNGYIENIGPGRIIFEKALDAGVGKILPPVNIPKGILLVHVDAVIPADEEKFQEQKDALYRDILMDKREDIMARWLEEEAPETDLRTSLNEL